MNTIILERDFGVVRHPRQGTRPKKWEQQSTIQSHDREGMVFKDREGVVFTAVVAALGGPLPREGKLKSQTTRSFFFKHLVAFVGKKPFLISHLSLLIGFVSESQKCKLLKNKTTLALFRKNTFFRHPS